MPQNELDMALFYAVQKNNLKEVKKLIEVGAHPVIREEHSNKEYQDSGRNLLHIAIDHRNPEMIKALINAGTSLTQEYYTQIRNKAFYYSPIVYASEKKYWKEVLVFAEVKFPEKKANFGGALFDAVCDKKHDVAEALAQTKILKADLDWHTKTQNYIYHHAVRNNDPAMIRLLRKYNIPTADYHNKDGLTALELAAKDGKWDCVDALIEKFELENPIDLPIIITKEINKELSEKDKYFYTLKSPDNKLNLLNQILNIQDESLKQKALWQALLPTTYLGKIFHLPRGNHTPTYSRGNLQKICKELGWRLLNFGYYDSQAEQAFKNVQIDRDVLITLLNANKLPRNILTFLAKYEYQLKNEIKNDSAQPSAPPLEIIEKATDNTSTNNINNVYPIIRLGLFAHNNEDVGNGAGEELLPPVYSVR